MSFYSRLERYNHENITNFKIKREALRIVVNGEDREFQEKTTLSELLRELLLDGKVMAAAVNMDIVKQDSWDKHILVDGDKLELLDFVGGG